MDADRLGLIVNFLAVAKCLSFAGAGEQLGTTVATVSRRVSRLEEELNARLLERTTRKVALTEAGRLYMNSCSGIMDQLNEADAQISSLTNRPNGVLKVSVPVAFGQLLIAPAMTDFMRLYPEVSIDISFTDRYVDFVEEGYDVAVRTGNLADSSLIARKIAHNYRPLVASPEYLKRKGSIPLKPADLANHECLFFSPYATSGGVWRFRRDEAIDTVKVDGHFRTDSSFAIYEAALSGLGVGVVAHYICHEAVADGRLVPLLTDWDVMPSAGIYLVQNSGRYQAPRVKAFSDFMSRRFKDAVWLHKPIGETVMRQRRP